MPRWIVPVLVALVVVTGLVLATGSRQWNMAEEPLTIDLDYINALSAADLFLGAWATRDGDRGYEMLSERLKGSRDKESLKLAIAGVSNPHHQAFEVFAGNRLAQDRFRFFVYLFETYTGQVSKPTPRPAPKTLTVARAAEGKWVIDDFPLSVSE